MAELANISEGSCQIVYKSGDFFRVLMEILKIKIRSWNLPKLLLINVLLSLMHIIAGPSGRAV